MDERKKSVLDAIRKAWPDLTDLEKERLLGFGEGLTYKIAWIHEQKKAAQQGKGA